MNIIQTIQMVDDDKFETATTLALTIELAGGVATFSKGAMGILQHLFALE